MDNTKVDVKKIDTFFLFTFTASKSLRKDTEVFDSFGRFVTLCFIGLKCRKYALNSCYIYNLLCIMHVDSCMLVQILASFLDKMYTRNNI